MVSAVTFTSDDVVGLIGDVHAEDELLETALTLLKQLGATRILCTGDIADGRGSVDRSCSLLREAGAVTVRGNHDRWVLADKMRDLPDACFRRDLHPSTIAFLMELPAIVRIASPPGDGMLCHGLGSDDMASVRPDDSGYALESNLELQQLLANKSMRLVFNGHSHRPMVRHFSGLTIVNAGTLFREHQPGFVVVDFTCSRVAWHGLGEFSARVNELGVLG
jgi:predicted phosphodiesterase